MIVLTPHPIGSIRNIKTYQQAKLLDHSKLAGMFARSSITPTDLDFIVEQDGNFLFGEFKYKGTEIQDGQFKCLSRFVNALGDKATAFVAEHSCKPEQEIDTSATEVVAVYFMCQGKLTAMPTRMLLTNFIVIWNRSRGVRMNGQQCWERVFGEQDDTLFLGCR